VNREVFENPLFMRKLARWKREQGVR
jgi:hypothetical protein